MGSKKKNREQAPLQIAPSAVNDTNDSQDQMKSESDVIRRAKGRANAYKILGGLGTGKTTFGS